MPYPAAGYLPKPLKGSPRQSFARFAVSLREPRQSIAAEPLTRANSRRQSLRLFNSAWHTKGGAQALPSPAAGNLPKPLKGPPRQSFVSLARTAAGKACACSISAWHTKGGAQALPYPAAGYLPKPLKGPPRQSFAPFCRFPSGASAKYRGRAAHAHEQPQAEPAPVQFSLAHQRGGHRLCRHPPPGICRNP